MLRLLAVTASSCLAFRIFAGQQTGVLAGLVPFEQVDASARGKTADGYGLFRGGLHADHGGGARISMPLVPMRAVTGSGGSMGVRRVRAQRSLRK